MMWHEDGWLEEAYEDRWERSLEYDRDYCEEAYWRQEMSDYEEIER